MSTTVSEDIADPFRRAKFAIFLGLFTAGVGNSFVFAVLPPIGREMGLMEFQVGFIITVSATIFMLLASFWGRKSEIWGRKPIMLYAMIVFSVMTVLFAVAIQLRLSGVLTATGVFLLLILFRAMFSMGISGLFPTAQAYMADITSPEERTSGMALVGMASGTGMIAGPAVAAIFAGYGILIPFYAVAVLAALSAIAVWAFIIEMPRPEFHADHHKERLVNRRLLPLLSISTIMMMALPCMQMGASFYIQDLFDLSTSEAARYSGMALMASACMSVFSQVVIVRRFRVQPAQLLRYGLPICLLGVTFFMMSNSYPLLVASMGCFGLGMGMVMPGNVAALSMSVNDHQQGRIAGINTSANGLGFIFGPLLATGFYQFMPMLTFITAAVLLSIACIVAWFVAHIPE